jgi:hypothetical protein
MKLKKYQNQSTCILYLWIGSNTFDTSQKHSYVLLAMGGGGGEGQC